MFELNRDRIDALAKNLEQFFTLFTKELVKELNAREQRELRFSIIGTGVTTGSVHIQFALAKTQYGSGEVDGNSIMAVCDEFARRQGWERVNKPRMLEFDGSGDLKIEADYTMITPGDHDERVRQVKDQLGIDLNDNIPF